MTIRDPLYIRRPKSPVPQQPDAAVNLNVGTLGNTPSIAYFLNETYVRVVPRYVQQPIQQNGQLQVLTFVTPTLPKNNYHWPNPFPRKPIPQMWSTSQGQNPAMIPPVPTFAGGGHLVVVSPGTMGRMMGRS